MVSHSTTQAVIDELRRRGFTVEVVRQLAWARKGQPVFQIKANVHGNRLTTIVREVEGV